MRMLKMGGAPRDRRIDRRKVATAAAAVFFLFAAKVQAQNIVDLVIDPQNSWLSVGVNGGTTSSTNGGFQPGNPDGSYNPATFLPASAQNAGLVNGGSIPAGSMNTGFFGHLYVAVNPGTSIQFFAPPGQNNIHNVTTGNYAPGEDNTGHTNPASPAQPGNIGARVTAIGALQRNYNSVYDSLVSLDPTLSGPAALPITGGNQFDTAGLVLPQTQGYEDITTGIGAGPYKISAIGNYPISFHSAYDQNTGAPAQGYVANNATVDPVTLHMIIPINFQLWNEVTVGSNRDYQVITLRGQIVADPPIPEPSTIILFGFGIVGLLSNAWRARKRRALVA